MLKKTYILTVIGKNDYGKTGVEVALDGIEQLTEIVGALCDYATNPLDFMIQTVVPDMAELSDEATAPEEEERELSEIYSNLI